MSKVRKVGKEVALSGVGVFHLVKTLINDQWTYKKDERSRNKEDRRKRFS